MIALSALVFFLSWWLGLYLVARDPRKPVLVSAAIGLCGFALVVAIDAVRVTVAVPVLGRIELYLTAVPAVAWLSVLLQWAQPRDRWANRHRRRLVLAAVTVALLTGATLAGGVDGPLRTGHWVMFAVISTSTLAAMAVALRRSSRAARPGSMIGMVVVATLFFALANAILIIPLALMPSALALASTGFDVLLLGVAVAVWDAFDEGQALRADMARSLTGAAAVAGLFGGQVMLAMALTGDPALTLLEFTSLAVAVAVQVFADPLTGLLDRLALRRSPALRAELAALRSTEAALPRRAPHPLADIDDDTFVRLTRRALGHYGDLAKLLASPLTALPVIDERLAARGAPDHPLERVNELKTLLAEHIERLKPRGDGEFGTTEQWRYYNALYFPYVAGVRAYAQNATAAGLDPVARQAWHWLVTEVPQRSLHNWQNTAARLIAADLRGRRPIVADR